MLCHNGLQNPPFLSRSGHDSCYVYWCVVMRIAIPIWQGRVSPVLDTARQLLLVDMDNGRELSRRTERMPQFHAVGLVRFIGELGVDVVICGSASRQLESLLEVSGIEVIPWVGGNTEEIVSAYSKGQLSSDHFFLPGCRFARGRRGRGRRCGRRRDFGFGTQSREDL